MQLIHEGMHRTYAPFRTPGHVPTQAEFEAYKVQVISSRLTGVHDEETCAEALQSAQAKVGHVMVGWEE
jgi:hypothetical protein